MVLLVQVFSLYVLHRDILRSSLVPFSVSPSHMLYNRRLFDTFSTLLPFLATTTRVLRYTKVSHTKIGSLGASDDEIKRITEEVHQYKLISWTRPALTFGRSFRYRQGKKEC